MIDLSQFPLFYPAVVALNLTPGNDMLFCLSQGIRSGPKAGIAASLGISTGSLIHTLLAALGLSALLVAYPIAFEIIRWAGIAYLVWLGVQTLLHFELAQVEADGVGVSVFRAFKDGVIVNLFNPKVAVFILAFIPQFVDPSGGSAFLQFLLLGLIFIANGTLVNGLVGTFAGYFGQLLREKPRFFIAFRYVSALIFFALALRMALITR